MSIIDSKYRDKYKGDADFVTSFINEHATDPVTREKTSTAEDGTKTTETIETGKRTVNLPNLVALAKANHLNVEKYDNADEQAKKNAPGRLRMTIGNMIRAAAKKRHGLNDLEGNFVEAPAEFVGDSAKTHNPDGTKIVVEKPKADAAAETAEA